MRRLAASISRQTLRDVFNHMAGRVKYKLGAKPPSLTCDSSQIESCDCSGFARYAIAKASNQQVIMPDGSQAQLEWVKQQGWAQKDYKNVGLPEVVADPSRWFICFLTPVAGLDWPRHVWLVSGGDTFECCGPEGSPMHSRSWNTMVLLPCRQCYEVPTIA